MMTWQQIVITTTEKYAENISDFFIEHGASAVSYTDAADQPIFEPELNSTPLWNKINVVGLFDGVNDADAIIDGLNNFLPRDAIIVKHVEKLPEQDWQKIVTKDIKPMQFGERLWVCPSWCESPDPKAVNVILDHGLAFGTGTHPTTALCLRCLEQNIYGDEFVVDYGCGSGILGIAAIKLGARKVVAVDIDPQALQATEENAKNNKIDESMLMVVYPENLPYLKANIVVANILAGPLIELIDVLSAMLDPGTKLVLSGILQEQVDSIVKNYCKYFTLANTAFEQEWALIEFVKM